MCGIVGIFGYDSVALRLYDGLIHLQHRGQDAAGMLTCGEHFHLQRGLGLVREIFSATDMERLQGNIGIAHARYPTAGGYHIEDTQPLWMDSPCGIGVAHNGNLVNYRALADEIALQTHHPLTSTTDSEILLQLLATGLEQDCPPDHGAAFFAKLCQVIRDIFHRAEGSYSVISLIRNKGLVAFRDPHGIRPLELGERVCADGKKEYIFASENTMFYTLDFQHVGSVLPGEVVFVNQEGHLFRERLVEKTFNPCIFEYVYFARPDAELNAISVYHARKEMGKKLAAHWRKTYPHVLPDVVVPAPFTSNTAAAAFANELGVRYAEGLYKNNFIGRTFIMANHAARAKHVRYKLTPQKSEVFGQKVLILDDSIVRGTTGREIVKMVREFGAAEIYFVSACPPILHPCFYGIDIPSHQELLAANLDIEGIRAYLGVDLLLYQTLEDLVDAVIDKINPMIKRPCLACMDGEYVCGKLDEHALSAMAQHRQNERDAL